MAHKDISKQDAAKDNAQDTAIGQMVQSVLKDMICSIIDEFEDKTGVRIGSVRIGPAGWREKREAEIEVARADGNALTGLMNYKKILCDHELLKESDFCVKG